MVSAQMLQNSRIFKNLILIVLKLFHTIETEVTLPNCFFPMNIYLLSSHKIRTGSEMPSHSWMMMHNNFIHFIRAIPPHFLLCWEHLRLTPFSTTTQYRERQLQACYKVGVFSESGGKVYFLLALKVECLKPRSKMIGSFLNLQEILVMLLPRFLCCQL